MKYFKVRNDIIKMNAEGNPTTTDEPKWLRDTIDTWKETYGENIGGGRFFADEDARYSYIISPNDNLMDLSQNDLEEISEVGIITIINKAFPPSVITREGEPDEIVPSPSLKKVCSIFWGYATNHTGTISVNETWALADNDHHITGNITINANIVLTIAAGCNVYYDGDYTITLQAGTSGKTTITAIGTSTSRITIEANASRTGTGKNTSISYAIRSANNNNITLQYCNLANMVYVVICDSVTGQTLVFDHLYVRNCYIFFSSNNASIVSDLTVSNSEFIDMAGAVGYFSSSSTATATHTLTNCVFYGTNILIGGKTSGVITVNFTDCFFLPRCCGANGYISSNYALNFTRCLFQGLSVSNGNRQIFSITDSILFASNSNNHTVYNNSGSTSNSTLTTTDLLLNFGDNLYHLINYSTAATTITATSVFMAGSRGADINNYYTGTETPAQMGVLGGGVITLVTPRTTRNFPFTASSIASSAIGDNSATISWTGTFRTRNRVRYGTSSGVYNMTVEPIGTWSNSDGKGQYAASPTIVLSNLKVDTVYYYVCESYDWVTTKWNTSAENTFQTTGALTLPTFSGISSLTDLASLTVGILASWSAATGTKTEYQIFIKKDNNTNLFTSTYLKCYALDTSTSMELYTYADNTTNIANGDTVFVGVRACNTLSYCDTNTTSISAMATLGSAPTFSGITGLENVGFGALLVSWGTATGTTTNYNIYAKVGSAPTFTEKPIKVDTSYLSFKLTHLSDGTRLTDSDNVYVSVRAENTPTLIDTNIAVLNEYVQGSGSVGVIVGDTVALSLKG